MNKLYLIVVILILQIVPYLLIIDPQSASFLMLFILSCLQKFFFSFSFCTRYLQGYNIYEPMYLLLLLIYFLVIVSF